MTRDEVLDWLGKKFEAFTYPDGIDAFDTWLADFMQSTYEDNQEKYNEGCAEDAEDYWGESWPTSFSRLVNENFFTEQQKDEIYCRFILAGLHRDDDSNRAASETSVTS